MERQRKEQEAVALKHRQMEEENKVAQTTYRRRIEEQRAKERERLEQNKLNREALERTQREEEMVRKQQQQQRERMTRSTSSRADRSSSQNPDGNKTYDKSQSTLRKHLDRIFLVFDKDSSDDED